MLSTLNTAVANGTIGKVAHVSSLAFRLCGQVPPWLSRTTEVSFYSWREEDYQKAVSCRAFMNEMTKSAVNPFPADMRFLLANNATPDDAEDAAAEEKESMSSNDTPVDPDDTKGDTTLSAREVLKAKYFYAGGSARFMLQTFLANLRLDLDNRMNRVEQGDWQSFTQMYVTRGTASAINTLIQQFEDVVCTPLSKYVLLCAYEKCKSDLVESVRAAAYSSRNPKLQGWAFELELIDLIRLSYESHKENPV
jgi:hypothetical protein